MSVRHRLAAWRELFKRYCEIWKHYWSQREVLTPAKLTAHEAEFLPAALSLQAQPVSPMGRWVARILIALIAVLLIWSVVGKIDIIVNAQGKIIPVERTKTISSVEVARVWALHVTEGQAVKAGDVLIELDTRATDAERDKAEGDRQTAMLTAARARALLAALNSGATPKLAPLEDVAPERWREAEQHLLDQWREFVAKKERLDGEIRRYSEELPLATQRAEDYAELTKNRDVANHAWLEKEQQRIELSGQLNQTRNQRNELIAETRKAAQDALNEASRVMASSSQDVRRATVHSDLLRLEAPVDGTVQQLMVHTVGGTVPAAQPLMQIVPAQGTVEMEAFIENKDVGFVQEGQPAQVKIDAFEYTKYGTVPAKVSHVSRDAIQDEKKGLIYSVKVILEKPAIQVGEKTVLLTPGLSGSVEVKTGTRRIIGYVLSPLLQHARESLRER